MVFSCRASRASMLASRCSFSRVSGSSIFMGLRVNDYTPIVFAVEQALLSLLLLRCRAP